MTFLGTVATAAAAAAELALFQQVTEYLDLRRPVHRVMEDEDGYRGQERKKEGGKEKEGKRERKARGLELRTSPVKLNPTHSYTMRPWQDIPEKESLCKSSRLW